MYLLFIHLQQLLNMLARVAESRHFILSTEFASLLHPHLKESWLGLYQFERLKSDILISLRLIVAVDFLKSSVECLGKESQVIRFLTEFHEPLVATFSLFVHEHWSCGIFEHLCPCLLTGVCKSLFGIIHNEFLTEGIDKMLSTAGD